LQHQLRGQSIDLHLISDGIPTEGQEDHGA
jgi:hypothetical protein